MASLADVVRLDDFASKLPPWTPDLPNHLYALVDMGSNGIRFSISDLSPPDSRLLRCLYQERSAISLLDALHSSGQAGPPAFPPDTIAQVSQTLARFKSIAGEYGVPSEHVSVFATEAARKASNAAAMLEAIKNQSGLGVHILAPEVETLLGAMGARSGFSKVKGLFLDLGGGSVQMTFVDSDSPDYAIQAAQTGKSLPFGAARLTHDLEKGDAETLAASMDELQSGMHHAFARLEQQFPLLRETQSTPDGPGVDIYLCGGGFRGYGSILMHEDAAQPYPIPAIGAYTVEGSFFKQTAAMRKVNAEYEGKIFGMSKRRRKQFPAIATVVEALIRAVPRIRTVTFCSGGNREGALLLKLPLNIREACPLSLLHPGKEVEPVAVNAIITTIQSALPSNMDQSNIPTVFTLGLGPLFASEIWTRTGEPSEANASFHLHQTLTRDPSAPGFTHLSRAVLGLTLCFRWGATLGPIDQELFNSLKCIVAQANPEALFWAHYIGAVARMLSKICPHAPKSESQLEEIVSYGAEYRSSKHKTALQLTVSLSPAMYKTLGHENIVDSFQDVGKRKGETSVINPCSKVEVLVQTRS
ncbi:Ppx/GppA phosphatase family-domain-containing protein [Poronia punctata]|nr:Ppx/GppA phosphatase family-domain-containing protein [Poronia punctata]